VNAFAIAILVGILFLVLQRQAGWKTSWVRKALVGLVVVVVGGTLAVILTSDHFWRAMGAP
jgi:hypothetical protein